MALVVFRVLEVSHLECQQFDGMWLSFYNVYTSKKVNYILMYYVIPESNIVQLKSPY